MNAVGVASTTVFNSVDDLLRVHGHQGRTGVHLVLDGGRVEEWEPEVAALRKGLDCARFRA
jgi:hypothetical protein